MAQRDEGQIEGHDQSEPVRIETTVGELVCAIADAAREAEIEEDELHKLTHVILMGMLKRAKS